MKRLALALLAALPLSAAEGDVLDALLARGGMTRADLGARGAPRAPRFEMEHVEALHREPLRLPQFGDRIRADVARLGAEDVAGLLLEGTIAPRGLRVTRPELPERDDLALVLSHVRRPLGADAALAEPGEADRADAARLPGPFRAPLAHLLAALDEADVRVRRAWADVPPGIAKSAVGEARLVRDLADGTRLFPQVDVAARGVHHELLSEAGVLATAAVERAARELTAASAGAKKFTWEVATPRGKVRVAGRGNDRHEAKDGPFLALVDLGGNDSNSGRLAAGVWPGQPVAILLDLGGNDAFEAGDAAQGCGLGGVGVLFDAGGNDRYRAVARAQGFAQLGVGVLVDAGGDDLYVLEGAGQGSAVFGSGLLLDRGGSDRYLILHDGQGFGGPGGAGLLADLSGNDAYEAVRDAAHAGRPDPKSDGKAATSNAQGVGLGRYGDLGKSQAWAGGIGALVDLAGDDQYSGGTWCQGAGYWFGTGLLVDAAGNDLYEAVWYAQGSAAHHALGLLLDRAGDDRYALVGTGGAGMGFGWDFATGELVDLAGNDSYRAVRLAFGAAMQRSFALFLDARGNDRYEVANPEGALGHVDDDVRFRTRDPLAPGWFEASQTGLFLDLGGTDTYPAGRGADGAAWGTWEEGRRTLAPRNLGAGEDATAAVPGELLLTR